MKIKQVYLNLKAQKLLSIIMITSIIAGITSLYILFAVRALLDFQLKQQLINLGENNFLATFIPDESKINVHPILQYEKMQDFMVNQKAFSVLPFSVIGSGMIYENQTFPGMVLAYSGNLKLLNMQALYGSPLSQDPNDNKKNIILGKDFAMTIQPQPHKLLDTYIQFQDQLLKIIGIYEVTGANLLDEDLNFTGLISYPHALRLTENVQLDRLYIINSKEDKNKIIQGITKFYHHNMALGNFHIKNADFMLGKIKAQFAQIQVVLKWICFISLALGTFIFIQLFLLSLDKRRFEIGIRLACGAGPKDIILQFMQESCLYYLIGGGIGIILGLTLIIGWLVISQIKFTFLVLIIPLAPIGIILLVLGLILGLLPGLRCLSLSPSDFFKPGL